MNFSIGVVQEVFYLLINTQPTVILFSNRFRFEKMSGFNDSDKLCFYILLSTVNIYEIKFHLSLHQTFIIIYKQYSLVVWLCSLWLCLSFQSHCWLGCLRWWSSLCWRVTTLWRKEMPCSSATQTPCPSCPPPAAPPASLTLLQVGTHFKGLNLTNCIEVKRIQIF